MNEIITERSGTILRIRLNRPAKKNGMTSGMYMTLADLLNGAAKDDLIRVVLLHGAGDPFSAGNDLEGLMKNPPGPGDSPQARLINALIVHLPTMGRSSATSGPRWHNPPTASYRVVTSLNL